MDTERPAGSAPQPLELPDSVMDLDRDDRPVAETEAQTSEGYSAVTRLIHEAGHLKNLPRSGWLLAGIPSAETVAEHVSRTTFIGLVLAALSDQELDIGRVTMMCAVHDLIETRIGDFSSVNKAYSSAPDWRAVAGDQLEGVPMQLAGTLEGLIEEYEERRTLESCIARDADKLECLAQALEYMSQGQSPAQEWIISSVESLSTDIGHQIASVMLETDSTNWWRSFVSRYRTPPPPPVD